MDFVVIDGEGYRANVGIIVVNDKKKVLLARCCNNKSWQFPQGGINVNEEPIKAAFRELYEEVGLNETDVELIDGTRSWIRYVVPERYRRKNNSSPVCIGQKQKWFLMRLVSDEKRINLNSVDFPEFDEWRWVDYWYPLGEVIFFKKDVYRSVLCELVSNVLEGEDRFLPKKYCINSKNKNANKYQKS